MKKKPDQASKIKILMLPTFHGANKYGSALVENVKQQDVVVNFIPRGGNLFPLLAIIQLNELPDIIHLHWVDIFTIKEKWWKSLLASIFYVFSLLTLQVLGVKIVWTVHDLTDLEERFSHFDIFIRSLSINLTDALIVHTKMAQQQIVNLYKISNRNEQKITVIPHGHYINQYPTNNISQAEARTRLGLDKNKFIFGFIGYIRPYKGVLNLIDAFNQIDGNHSCLLIAGKPFDPSFGRIIEEAARGNHRIHLNLDFIADEDLQIFLNAVDVVVLPFTRSLTSGSLILAMSFGKAVIVSDALSVLEVLPAEGGIIYKNGDLAGLIQALQKIQTMDVVSMGQRNLERARTFDWAYIARATIQVYQKTLY